MRVNALIFLTTTLATAAPVAQLSTALGQLGAAIPQPGEDPASSIPDLTGALGSAVNAIPGASGGGRARRQLDAALGQLTDAIPMPGEDPAGSIPDLTDALGSAVNAIPGANGGGA